METKKCTKCGLIQDITQFYPNIAYHGGRQAECISCTKIRRKESYRKTLAKNTDIELEKIAVTNPRKTCLTCGQLKPISEFAIKRNRPDGHMAYCRTCVSEKQAANRAKRLSHKPSQRKYDKTRNVELKHEALSHYSKGSPICANPFKLHSEDVTDTDVLTIDHINGGGCVEQYENGRRIGGSAFYAKLKRENYPDGFQVLCGNCQMKKRILNGEVGYYWAKRNAAQTS